MCSTPRVNGRMSHLVGGYHRRLTPGTSVVVETNERYDDDMPAAGVPRTQQRKQYLR